MSNDLKQMKPITAITYQALYSAMKTLSGRASGSGGGRRRRAGSVLAEETEAVDFREFDILAAVKEAGVKTICLDEAHHLRSEWWKALESFMKEMKG